MQKTVSGEKATKTTVKVVATPVATMVSSAVAMVKTIVTSRWLREKRWGGCILFGPRGGFKSERRKSETLVESEKKEEEEEVEEEEKEEQEEGGRGAILVVLERGSRKK